MNIYVDKKTSNCRISLMLISNVRLANLACQDGNTALFRSDLHYRSDATWALLLNVRVFLHMEVINFTFYQQSHQQVRKIVT